MPVETAIARSIVVVVEDEPLIRLSATEMFEEAGIEVVEFTSGDEAIDFVREHRKDVAAVFTDVYLPGEIDGLELAGIVSEVCPEIAVMVTSGQIAKRPDELRPQIRYVAKPWRPAAVLSAMTEALRAIHVGPERLSPAA